MPTQLVINKKARFDFEFLEEIVAGIVLLGSEVKSIRGGKAHLKDSFCYFNNDELFSNFHITENNYSSNNQHDPDRPKKLLLTGKQLKKLKKQVSEKGVSIVPYRIISNDKSLIKVVLKLAKGKKQFDKRNTIKDRDISRELKKEL
jgi:SsrA-binding protein